MLIREIVTEARLPRKPSEAVLTQAETAGFDISKLWFHGTRKRFDGFRLPKERGIEELGSGVYLTSIKWLAKGTQTRIHCNLCYSQGAII